MNCIASDRSFTVEIDIEIEQGCEGGRTLFSNRPHALDRLKARKELEFSGATPGAISALP
jgi:hypothetical protein